MYGMLGGSGGSLWRAQLAVVRRADQDQETTEGGEGTGVTGKGAYPGGESPGSGLISWVWALLPTFPLTWAQARSWFVPAVCCDTPSAAPPRPLRSLWAAEVRPGSGPWGALPQDPFSQYQSLDLPATPPGLGHVPFPPLTPTSPIRQE